MGNVTSLSYPKKSNRKPARLPESSVFLAEFFGIMLGDGGINNPWQANITLNAVKDIAFARHVRHLIRALFAVTPTQFRYKTRNALRILVSSVSVVDFLVSKGLKRGDKLAQGLRIPRWILGSSEYKRACVRGLVDTDGCIFIHKHIVAGKPYKNIGLTFSSRSPELIFQVAAIFEEFGIVPHITGRGTDIYIYREAGVARYLKVFGSSNTRIKSVYAKWKRG
ncbi:MAG: LAGLIDADG family homing endonuclease [bacterium]